MKALFTICSIIFIVSRFYYLGKKRNFEVNYDFVVMELFKSRVNSTPQTNFVKQSIDLKFEILFGLFACLLEIRFSCKSNLQA